MTPHMHVLSRSPELPTASTGNALDLNCDLAHVGHRPVSRRPARASSPSPIHNHLLAALPPDEMERLSQHLELVQLPLGATLYEPGRRLQYAYFPTTCVVSLHYLMESGAAAEAAGVGNEGVVGISLSMGRDTTPNSAVVQTAGFGYRLAGRVLQQEFDRAGAMQRLLLRYTQVLMAQMIQTAACNQHHRVEQKLSRFLLLTLDRVNSRKLIMTQERVGNILGVRRETVAEAAGRLQRIGAIGWRRGYIEVLDRSGLEARACECYSMMRAELSCLKADVQSGNDVPPPGNYALHIVESSAGSSMPSAQATLSNWQRSAEIALSEVRQ